MTQINLDPGLLTLLAQRIEERPLSNQTRRVETILNDFGR